MTKRELMAEWMRGREARGDVLLGECRNEAPKALGVVPANDLPLVYMALVSWHPYPELGMRVHEMKSVLERYVFSQMNEDQQTHCFILCNAFAAMTKEYGDAE